ncbi:MAG TPA: hypothetical protein VKW04_00565 [Planctomycetota bacterium]|nr:hypothetical protein [Planctomycetota bacterium]
MRSLAALGLVLLGTQELPVLVREDFEKGAGRWEFSDPNAWKVADGPNGKMLSLFEKTTPALPHKSPFALALLKDVSVGDFVLEADVQSTGKRHPQQDLCLFFGYQDNAHFYYSHLARKTDKHHNQIFIVNGADRAMISLRTTEGTDWSDEWVHVKVVRKVADGTIEVYWDDMKTPAQTAQNRAFAWGRVGVGSYEDLGNFDNVLLRGIKAGPDPK